MVEFINKGIMAVNSTHAMGLMSDALMSMSIKVDHFYVQ